MFVFNFHFVRARTRIWGGRREGSRTYPEPVNWNFIGFTLVIKSLEMDVRRDVAVKTVLGRIQRKSDKTKFLSDNNKVGTD